MSSHQRYKPHVNLIKPSPFASSRGGARPTLIVVHATAGHNRPGVTDLAALGEWFQNPAAQASSHVGIDNEGHSARFVADRLKAWTVCAYNRMTLNIEQIMPGDGTEITDDLYRECARWIAWWSKGHDIPIRKGAVRSGYVARSGVLRHSELGTIGCNHDDPGPGYDLHHVLALARFYRGKI